MYTILEKQKNFTLHALGTKQNFLGNIASVFALTLLKG